MAVQPLVKCLLGLEGEDGKVLEDLHAERGLL
jgi:hypothetical protein